ncbi:MAG: hypothetical protein JJT76_03525 [Clostridiaceae bacterium]|nr:hypothetical protein [Clostridiaceae bacterium]
MIINYENEEHRKKVLGLLKKYNKIHSESNKVDIEYLSAFFLLSTSLLNHKKLEKYIHPSGIGINFLKMVEDEYLSSSEEVMIKVAWNLYNSDGDIKPIEIIRFLSNENYNLVIQAMELRRVKHYLEEL